MIFIRFSIILLTICGGQFVPNPKFNAPPQGDAGAQATSAPASLAESTVPDVAYEDLALLVQKARRAIRAAVQA